MQKHQWRQHGIVHFKARPHPAGINTTGPPTAPLVSATDSGTSTPIEIEPAAATPSAAAASVLYNSIVDRIKYSSLETRGESSRHLDGPPPPPPPVPQQQRPPASPQSGPEDLSNHRSASPSPPPLPLVRKEPDEAAVGDEFKNAKPLEESAPLDDNSNSRSSNLSESTHSHSRSASPQPNNARLLTALPPLPNNNNNNNVDEDDDHRPIKLKKLLAHAYQKEVEEAEEMQQLAQQQQQQQTSSSGSGSGEKQEMVECQCKSCGHVFSVLDPYNFRCGNCNVKYTSLPTHMIADPLQCIGCCQVFPHKPALKAHQMGGGGGGNVGERPFRCCKCGYGFRQKAHLQKHQWRIHRRKLEPDPNVREAEALFNAIKGTTPTQTQPPKPSLLSGDGGIATITIQDIIDRGVERSLMKRNLSAPPPPPPPQPQQQLPQPPKSPSGPSSQQPLDLSPTKSSINQQQQPRLSDLVAAMPSLPPSAASKPPIPLSSLPLVQQQQQRETPLLNQQLPLQLPTQPLRLTKEERVKRQKTSPSSPPPPPAPSLHRSLPPIAALQRPTTTATTTNHPDLVLVKRDLRDQLNLGLMGQTTDVRTV